MNEAYANWKKLMVEQTELTRRMVAKAREVSAATLKMMPYRDEVSPEVTEEAIGLMADAAQIMMELLTILLNPPQEMP